MNSYVCGINIRSESFSNSSDFISGNEGVTRSDRNKLIKRKEILTK